MTFTPLEDGRWVSLEFVHLAEIIQDYDHYLELHWIPPEQRTTVEDRTRPYVIIDTRITDPQINNVVCYASEQDTPKGILEKLFDIDNKNGDVLKRMNARNAALRAFELKQQMDEREQAKDLAAFFVKNEKSRVKHNGIWFDDEMRRL